LKTEKYNRDAGYYDDEEDMGEEGEDEMEEGEIE
jgi:hypothetical protein